MSNLLEAIEKGRQLIPHQPEWLRGRTIFLTVHGSHAYGTSRPESDVDIKGIALPPKEYFLGYANVFEQSQQKLEKAKGDDLDADITIFDLRKFMKLAADCNPSVIEVLWTQMGSEWLYVHPAGELLINARRQFLSRKAKYTFCGYAISQLKRIKSHRRWLMEPPKAPPTRAEFGLQGRRVLGTDEMGAAMSQIKKFIDGWELNLSDLDDASRIHIEEQLAKVLGEKSIDDFQHAGKLLGFDDNLLTYLEKEKKFNAAQKQWENYQVWQVERNEIRADLERKHGYDTKHAMHLVRLMRMCREILTDGVVHVKRPDAEELLAIRNGAWTYDQLIEFGEREDKELDAVMRTSPLPRAPDRAALDALCVKIVGERLALDDHDTADLDVVEYPREEELSADDMPKGW